MSAITENNGFDISPLSWVKGEIDVALNAALGALKEYLTERESTRVKFARTHLQQAHGALTMVGIDGVIQVTEALDTILAQVESGEAANVVSAIAVVERGFSMLRQYLSDLLVGEPHQPLRLLPIYREIAAALGKQQTNPIDLFFPDLSRRPPRRKAKIRELSNAAREKFIHAERVLFQKGLLIWLRARDKEQAKDGLSKMRAALRHIEITQTSPSVRAFWWAALGFVTSLLNGGEKIGDARSLCARIDQQIRRLQEGNPGIAERLLRDCLYYVANMPESADPLLKEIQDVYRLKRLIPTKDQALQEINMAQASALHSLKEIIAAASEQWNRFCSGSAPALTAFVEQSKNAPQYVAVLGEELKPLSEALLSTAVWLIADASRQTDTLAMEVATALILMQHALENYSHLGGDFPAQMALVVQRLTSCRVGQTLADADAPILDEMTRRAQEKMLMTQVAREIQTNLGEVEQLLDDFFRDNSKRPQALELETPLNQVAGALSILGQEEAVAYLKACKERVLAFARPDYVADSVACEEVAREISTLGFFVDALAGGEISFGEFRHKFEVRVISPAEIEDEEAEEEKETVASVELQLEKLKAETRNLLSALQADPENAKLRNQLASRLEGLQKDADLVADEALLSQAKAALKALKKTKESAPRVEAVAEALAPISSPPVLPQPSAETMQLVEAGEEELDAELLEIFLEEAQEVLATIRENLDVLYQQPNDVENLMVIRRSIHTLKGSGRMVGLKDLGETAWEVEQTLNLWLRQEMLVTPELLEMIQEAHQTFLVWVNAISARDHASIPNRTALIAHANAMRGAGGEVSAVPGAAEEPETEEKPDIDLSASQMEGTEIDMSASQIFAGIEPLVEEAVIEDARLENFADVLDIGEATEEVPALEVEANERGAPENPIVAPEQSEYPAALEQENKGEEKNIIIDGLSISPQLYEIFRDESTGHLNTLQNFISMLEQSSSMDTPYEVGRAAHTLAGIAGTVGIKPINTLAHELEMALLRRNESDRRASLEGMEILGQTVETLVAMQASLSEGNMPEARNKLIKMLSALYPPAVEEDFKAEPYEEEPSVEFVAQEDVDAAYAILAGTEEGEQLSDYILPDIAQLDLPDSIPEYPPIPTVAAEEDRSEQFDTPLPELPGSISGDFPLPVVAVASAKEPEGNHFDMPQAHLPDSILADFSSLAIPAELVEEPESNQVEMPQPHLPDSISEDFPAPAAPVVVSAQELENNRFDVPQSHLPDSILEDFSSLAVAAAPFEEQESDQIGQISAALHAQDRAPENEEPTAAGNYLPVEATGEFAALQAMADDANVPSLDVDYAEAPPVESKPEFVLPILKDEFDDQLMPIFLEEAIDLLSGFQKEITAWRANRKDEAAPHALARLLHTFKGGARMAGAMNLGELTHATETRVGELAHVDGGSAADLDEIASIIDTLAETVERYRAGNFAAIVAPASLGKALAGERAPVMPMEAPSLAQSGQIEQLAEEPEKPTPQIQAVPEGEGARAQMRVRADLVDQLVNEAGELSIARARIEGEMRDLKGSLVDLTENVIRLRRQLREIEIQAETQIQARTGMDAKADFDPLELDRFTRFQELTRMMAESVNDVATVQQNLLKNLDGADAAIIAQARLNRHLQQALMSVRMVPFYSQSERLYRLVRLTAKELDKRANLDIHGGQVEMDRSVLEKILSPLEHMLRNAIAHGLEAQEGRIAAGKPETGEIVLSLVQEGNEVILTLSDDGSGMDVARIRAKAESAGLLKQGQKINDQELLNFIFTSGFSTASSVSRVAGRGVGMDVVKTEISALGGRIEIINNPGEGATFRLYLPLTLAVTQVVLIQVADRLFAVPSAMVEQVMEVKERIINEMRSKGEAVWQGRHYPFHYLPRLLGDNTTVQEPRRLYWVMLLRSGNQRVAVLIDEMYGNQEIVVKNVGPQMARVVGIAGASVLGDGRVVLILNPVALASRMTGVGSQILEAAARQDVVPKTVAAESVSRQPSIMIVDDSLTVRKITSRLLAREGYQVVLAKDGVDALEQLLDFVPDAILSDIEMPRMDGFDLVRNIRADQRLKKIPIIMITSRTADKHRNLAKEIGADHYLGKPYNEEELLELLAGYIRR
ncbi:MAG: Hpt domain-containing protein [Betaproteobacteria bacterium]|nr:Hpt domain-containing protein [Betaproteobacteria bacterium]